MKIASLITDQPMTGLERAVWWTEYVIRHGGAQHLRNPALDLPWYQYFLLDVIGFTFLVFLIIIYSLVKFISVSNRMVNCLIVPKKLKAL